MTESGTSEHCLISFCVYIAEREKDLKLLEAGQSSGKETFAVADIDADEEDESSFGESSSDDDDEDEEAELMAELERIRKERAEESARAAALAADEEEQRMRAEVAGGNPLLQESLTKASDFRIKRRWDDDVVFRNQSSTEPVKQRRFINDTIRNDFHRRFLDRYMK